MSIRRWQVTGTNSGEGQMEKLKFAQIQKDNKSHFLETAKLWMAYIQELGSHDGTNRAENEIINNLRKRIGIQGKRPDMHFEIAYLKDEPIGIANFAIDLGTINGLIESGYGTEMEFYIISINDLKLYEFEAVKHETGFIKINNEYIETVRIRIKPSGFFGSFWHADYWFRLFDGEFVRYEAVHGAPGTTPTIKEIVLN